ncbi:MAG TPA: cell division ATP-binding protein FtsE [Burkholderiales bacterium]|nr:cell division ATP-binding protein FtsE [Burkholderiales bacterium]
MSVIRFNHVSKRYPGGYPGVHDLSLDIEAGEMLFVTGHSGAGKSTLLKLIALIERPTSGTLLVNGQNVGVMRSAAIPFMRRNLGIIFQDQKLLYDRSVFDNVLLPLQVCGHPPREALKRARAALDKVGLLERDKANPIALSGGEQQRLCIARAIVHRPSILIADEPTANLDGDTAGQVMDIFKSFHQVGVTVLVATHDLGLVSRYASRTVHLDQGKLAA